MFPALPVSRLLFSLNDSDVPLYKPFNYLYALTQMTAYLPTDVQAAVLNMFVAFLMNLLAVLFYHFGLVSAPGAVAVAAVVVICQLVYAVMSYQPAKPPSRGITESDLDIVPFKVTHAGGRLTYRKINSFRPLRSLSEAVDEVSARSRGAIPAGLFRDGRGEEIDESALDSSGASKDKGLQIPYGEGNHADSPQIGSRVEAAGDGAVVHSASSSMEAAVEPSGVMYRSVKSAFELQMQEIYSKVSSTVDIQQPPSPMPVPSAAAESDPTYYSGLSIVEVRAMMDSSGSGVNEMLLSIQKETAMVVSSTQQEQDDDDDDDWQDQLRSPVEL
jgi:hypothetical protein